MSIQTDVLRAVRGGKTQLIWISRYCAERDQVYTGQQISSALRRLSARGLVEYLDGRWQPTPTMDPAALREDATPGGGGSRRVPP